MQPFKPLAEQCENKFLDIFVVINNNALMPEVFTMVVSDIEKKPQYPKNIDYPALPISGVPETINSEDRRFRPMEMPNRNGISPSIFYLEEGIMLFFRVPLAQADSLASLYTDNYFGPQDLMNGGNDIPPFFF